MYVCGGKVKRLNLNNHKSDWAQVNFIMQISSDKCNPVKFSDLGTTNDDHQRNGSFLFKLLYTRLQCQMWLWLIRFGDIKM